MKNLATEHNKARDKFITNKHKNKTVRRIFQIYNATLCNK